MSSQQTLLVDVAPKLLADNLTSLMNERATEEADIKAKSRKCNRAYAAQFREKRLSL